MLGALDKVQDRNGLERGELSFLEQAHFKTKGTLLSLQLYIYIHYFKKRESCCKAQNMTWTMTNRISRNWLSWERLGTVAMS